MQRGIVTWLVVVVLVASGVTACGSGSGRKLTLNLFQMSAYKAGQEAVNENFERAHPNIEIKTTYVETGSHMVRQVLPGLQAGSGPDAWFTTPANAAATSVWPLAESGKLMDLSHRRWAKDVPSILRDGSSHSGKLYGMPMTVTLNGILYNVQLWNQLGLTPPQTLSELLATCRKVDAAGKRLFAVSLGGSGGGITGEVSMAILLMNEFVYAVDQKWTDKRTDGAVKFANSPLWSQAYQALIDMRNAKCFNDSPEATTVAEAQGLVVTGKSVAFMTSGSVITAVQKLKPDLKLQMVPLPATESANTVASMASAVIVVNAATKHTAEVQKFVDFMAQRDQLAAWAKANNVVSPLDAEKGVLPDYLASMKPYLEQKKVVTDTYNTLRNRSLFTEVLSGYIPGIISGQVTTDKLLADADHLWDNPDATSVD